MSRCTGGRDADAALEILLEERGLMAAFQKLLQRDQPVPVVTQAAHLLAVMCSDSIARDMVRQTAIRLTAAGCLGDVIMQHTS